MLALADKLFVQIWVLFHSFYRLTFFGNFYFLNYYFMGFFCLNKHENGGKGKMEIFGWHFKKLETTQF